MREREGDSFGVRTKRVLKMFKHHISAFMPRKSVLDSPPRRFSFATRDARVCARLLRFRNFRLLIFLYAVGWPFFLGRALLSLIFNPPFLWRTVPELHVYM